MGDGYFPKGAVLITTKRGKNDGLKVEVQANAGLNVAKSFPDIGGIPHPGSLHS